MLIRKHSPLMLLVFGLAFTLGGFSYLKYSPRFHPPSTPDVVRKQAQTVAEIDAARMQRHVQILAGLGVRRAGTPAEAAAANFAVKQFSAAGYIVTRQAVPLPNGRTSMNISAELPGVSDRIILLGAHLDSKYPSPGANDNASGVAVLLEVARALKTVTPPYTVRFVAIGAEEMIDRHRDHHHYGSRLLAADAGLRARLHAMTAIDMVGVGQTLYIQHTGQGPTYWRDHLSRAAKRRQMPVRCGRGKPWSDHEAFERYGVPTAYLHWERDAAYHTRRDNADHVSPARLRQTAELVVQSIMSAESLE